jgi:hypothetical protein
MADPEEVRIRKIVEEVCRLMSLNPADLHIKIPQEVSGSDDEAFEQIKHALLKEFIVDINNKLTLPLTTLKELSDRRTVEDKLISLSSREIEKAVELLKKLNEHLE